MVSRTQITFAPEMQRRARQRAADLGISLAEYIRRLVTRDLSGHQPRTNASEVFDLGASNGSDVARNKDSMLAEAQRAAMRKA